MYEFSYSEVIEESPQVMRAHERLAMDRVIAMLRTARARGPGTREVVEALFYLRRLWAIFLDDLRNPENELPGNCGPGRFDRHLDEQGDRSRAFRSDERPDADDRNQRNHSRRLEMRIL